MPRSRVVSESVVVAAELAEVWAAVSDPTRTRLWSPENVGAEVDGPLAVGASFEGRNRRFGMAWTTRCVVTELDPQRTFAFQVRAIGPRTPRLRARVATWQYRLDPVAAGTEVTETWTDDRPWPDLAASLFDRVVTRGSSFAEHNRRNISSTLAGLQRELAAPRR